MTRRPVLGLVLPILAVSLACNRSERAQSASADRSPVLATSVAQLAKSAPLSQAASLASFWAAQKLIRTGELQIRVSDVPRASHAADSIARAHGGMLADSRVSQDAGDARQAQLVFRIPSERFAEASAALRRLGDVRTETVNTQDITKEYADLDTRLAVQQQTVARLRGLLDTHTAKLSDVLDVERELARSVSELEQMKAARRFYDQQVALSTLTLVLFESTGSRGTRLTTPVANALRGALEVLGISLAGLVYAVVFLLPWLLLAAAAWWLAQRWRRRPSRARGVPAVGSEPPAM